MGVSPHRPGRTSWLSYSRLLGMPVLVALNAADTAMDVAALTDAEAVAEAMQVTQSCQMRELGLQLSLLWCLCGCLNSGCVCCGLKQRALVSDCPCFKAACYMCATVHRCVCACRC